MARVLAELRSEILPHAKWLALNRKFPAQALWFPVLVSMIIFFSWVTTSTAHSHPGRAPFLLALALLIGLLYSSLALFTHELLHGSILRTDRPITGTIARAMAWCGFALFGLSPELWLVWHNRVHHFNTNDSGIDPDCFGLWKDFKTFPMSKMLLNRSPGSGHWLSLVYLPLNFSNQVLNIMWYFLWKGDPKQYSKVDRTRAVAETLAMYLFWGFVASKVGGYAFLFVFVIPVLVANLVLSSYILVQHLLVPLTDINEPFENTLGVSGPEWIENLHFRFGYHIEHHLFPEANHSFFPRLRETLKARYPQQYRLMPHAQALRLLLSTPRVYRDAFTLFEPEGAREFDVRNTGKSVTQETGTAVNPMTH